MPTDFMKKVIDAWIAGKPEQIPEQSWESSSMRRLVQDSINRKDVEAIWKSLAQPKREKN